MKNSKIKWITAVLSVAFFSLAASSVSFAGMDLETGAAVSGISVALNNYYARSMEPDKALAQSVSLVANGTIVVDTSQNTAAKKLVEEVAAKADVLPKKTYENMGISQVTDSADIRADADTGADIVGKIYNNSAATILGTVGGTGGTWYKIKSGDVVGYIQSQYLLTGSEAEAKAQDAGTTYGTIDGTSTLRLRESADMNSKTLSLLARGAKYQIVGQEGDYLKVQVDDDLTGYVFKDYIKTNVEFTHAVSKEEEDAKAAEESSRAAAAEAAAEALKKAQQEESSKAKETTTAAKTAAATKKTAEAETVAPKASEKSKAETEKSKEETVESNNKKESEVTVESKKDTEAETTKAKKTTAAEQGTVAAAPGSSKKASGSGVTSAKRSAIIAYAEQYLGNPYVFGGTSLTDGTDCSGFTMRVYEHFGIDIGRSSRDQAANGKSISESDLKPGDLLFYASGDYINHVAMYIGNGTVIHASSPTNGIIESPSNYRTPCKIVSFIN